MIDPTDLASDSTERTTEQEMGLIAAMIDGEVDHFDFRGFEVLAADGAMYLTDRKLQQTLGGGLCLERATVQFAHDWLTRKVAHHEANAAIKSEVDA